MEKFYKICRWVFVFTTISMISLLVWGFILPPIGEIPESDIKAAGVILVPMVLAQIPIIIKAVGDVKTIKISAGKISAEITK